MGSSTKYILMQLAKIIIVVTILGTLVVIGAMVGFGVIGDGDMMAVFNSETWTHITDFLK